MEMQLKLSLLPLMILDRLLRLTGVERLGVVGFAAQLAPKPPDPQALPVSHGQ